MDSKKSDAAPQRPAISFPPNAVHLVRTNQQITMQLSQMADQKASILMGATFVVFTLAVGQARAGAGAFALPLAVLATFSFLSALLAISAVLPRVGKAPPAVVPGRAVTGLRSVPWPAVAAGGRVRPGSICRSSRRRRPADR